MKIKKERKKMPVEMQGVVTSLRLRPDRLAIYKQLGGVKFLNMILDEQIYIANEFKETNEVATGR